MAPLHLFSSAEWWVFYEIIPKFDGLSLNKVDKYIIQIALVEFYPNFSIIVMDSRIDSCRNCGEDVEILSTCMVCEQPSKFQCSNCFHYVDDPVHTECVIFDDHVI